MGVFYFFKEKINIFIMSAPSCEHARENDDRVGGFGLCSHCTVIDPELHKLESTNYNAKLSTKMCWGGNL